MLRAFFFVGEQLVGEALVLFDPRAVLARSGDDGHLVIGEAHENFRARADDLKVAEIEKAQKRRRIDPSQRAVKSEGRERERRREALRQHHLEYVAGANISFARSTISRKRVGGVFDAGFCAASSGSTHASW